MLSWERGREREGGMHSVYTLTGEIFLAHQLHKGDSAASSQASLTSGATGRSTQQRTVSESQNLSLSPWQSGLPPADIVSPEASSTPINSFASGMKQHTDIRNATGFPFKASTLPVGGASNVGREQMLSVSTSLISVGEEKSPLHQSHQVVRTITEWGRFSTLNVRSPPPDPEIKTVVLVKNDGKSLGFTVCGGIGTHYGDVGIFVKTVAPGGLAAQDGRLREGDELLELNEQSFANCTHEQAASIIKVCVLTFSSK